MPQTWTSDNTDAVCRLKIQHGTSMLFPTVSMGAHVSAVPNHQVGRTTSLETRYIVAAAGNLGYELDLQKLSQDEMELIKKQIAQYKRIRRTVQFGAYYRLADPFSENQSAWNFVSEDGKQIVLVMFRFWQDLHIGFQHYVSGGWIQRQNTKMWKQGRCLEGMN